MVQQSTSDDTAENGDLIQQPTQDVERAITNEKAGQVPLSAAAEGDEGKLYPPARKVIVVMVALYLSLFLVSLVSSRSMSDIHFPSVAH